MNYLRVSWTAAALFGLAAWLAAPPAFAACVEAPDGISAWWSLDSDAGGGTFADWIGGPDAASPTGALPLIAGEVSNAVELNGVDQYLSVPAVTGSDLSLSGMTIMAWVRLSSASGGPIVAREPRYRLDVSSDGLIFSFCDDQVCYTSGLIPATIPTSQWVHVAMAWGPRFDQGSESNFYVDGQLIQSKPWSGVGGDIATTGPLTIGYSLASEQHLAGDLDEVMLFKRTLDASEIQAIWAAGADGVCAQDCNGNAVLDAADIAAGTSPDCNGNGVPDACDVNPADPDGDGMVFTDCNGNNVPDVCEPDCNANGVPDVCDIDPADPDGDGVVWSDCNGNLVLDVCEGMVGPIYVDDDPGPETGPIGGPTHPFTSIQAAINATQSGCAIMVLPGTYSEGGITTAGKSLTLTAQDGPATTIVHPPSGQCGFIVQGGGEVVLDGFRVTLGSSAGNQWQEGGGLLVVSGTVTARQCIFDHCSSIFQGGGASVRGAGHLTLEDCLFEANNSVIGGVFDASSVTRCTFLDNVGGGALSSRPATFTDCIFIGNSGTDYGGGLYVSTGSVVDRCRFESNTAQSAGGGLYASSSCCDLISIRNSVFTGNSSGLSGGGLLGKGQVQVRDCTFGNNQSYGTGGGITNGYNSVVKVWNSIVWGNTPDNISGYLSSGMIQYSIIQGGLDPEIDPLYDVISVDPTFVDLAGNDLRLRPNSPAIDAGLNSYVVGTVDILNHPRLVDDPLVTDTGVGNPPIVDMGAYEGAAGVSGGIAGLAPGGHAVLSPDGAGADPRDALTIDITNESQDSGDVWFSALGDLHGDAGDIVVLPARAIIETSLPDGNHLTRVSLPFTAADLGSATPAQVDLLTFDDATVAWTLAVAGNTAPSPGHAGPVGDRSTYTGWPPPALSTDLGDYGVVWDPGMLKGFAWANVDHTTDFAAGYDQTNVAVEPPGAGPKLPAITRLLAPAPNPSFGSTTISFDLSGRLDVDLGVYDLAGRRVRSLVSGWTEAGEHHLSWNGLDDRGRAVRTGIYFVRLVAGDHTETQRIVTLE